MKQIRFDKGGGKVQSASKNGTTVKKAEESQKPPMTKNMVNMVLEKIREGNKDDAMTLLKAWSSSYQVNISDFFPKKQGESNTQYRELGIPQILADPTVPRTSKAKQKSYSDGAEEYSGVAKNDIHLKARSIAMNTAKTNLDDLRVAYRVGGGGASEADFKAYCQRNGIAYTPPKSTKWLGN